MADDDAVPPTKRWRSTPRLKEFKYDREHRALLVGELAELVMHSVFEAAQNTSHQLLAYVVMPNHVHTLIQGTEPETDAVKFVAMAKQRPGYEYKRQTRRYLWLPGFYDRIVRRGDDARQIVAYIVDNPVRTGLIAPGGHGLSPVARLSNRRFGGAKAPLVLV